MKRLSRWEILTILYTLLLDFSLIGTHHHFSFVYTFAIALWSFTYHHLIYEQWRGINNAIIHCRNYKTPLPILDFIWLVKLTKASPPILTPLCCSILYILLGQFFCSFHGPNHINNRKTNTINGWKWPNRTTIDRGWKIFVTSIVIFHSY